MCGRQSTILPLIRYRTFFFVFVLPILSACSVMDKVHDCPEGLHAWRVYEVHIQNSTTVTGNFSGCYVQQCGEPNGDMPNIEFDGIVCKLEVDRPE